MIDQSLAGSAEDFGRHPGVLVIDDDLDCLYETCDLIRGLGYKVRGIDSALTAIEMLNESKEWGILLVDLQMPQFDGMSFLEELAARFRPIRPLVPIIVTGHATLDVSVEAMRLKAADMLIKPVSSKAIAPALRRAALLWREELMQLHLAGLSDVSPGDIADAPVGADPDYLASARHLRKERAKVRELFANDVISDPAWDILVELTIARLENQPVPVSSACAASHASFSTGLRFVNRLTSLGLVERWPDPTDKRRDLLRLSDHGLELMKEYLAST